MLIISVACVGHHVALQGSTAVTLGHLDGIELIYIGIGTLANTLHAPLQTQVGRQNLLGFRTLEKFADGLHIALGSKTHHAAVCTLSQLKAAQKGVLLVCLLDVGGRESVACLLLLVSAYCSSQVALGSLHSISGNLLLCHECRVGLCGISLGFLLDTAQRCSQLAIQCHQERSHLGSVIGLPELQVGTALQELAHTLGLLHTRHLHHDATLLALESLDIGLHHSKAVDTGAEHVVRVGDGAFHFGTKHTLHLLVGALGGHLVAQLLRGKELSQRLLRGESLIVLDKQGDEITLAVGCLCSGLLNGTAEVLVGLLLVVGQRLHHIGHAYLQDDVHTALEIQSQTDAHLAAFLQCPYVTVHLVVEH